MTKVIDKIATYKKAEEIKKKLLSNSTLGLVDGDVSLKVNTTDGDFPKDTVTIDILPNKQLPSGSDVGATVKNISKATDEYYRELRQSGDIFSQPMNGVFTIGLYKKGLNESFTFEQFLETSNI